MYRDASYDIQKQQYACNPLAPAYASTPFFFTPLLFQFCIIYVRTRLWSAKRTIFVAHGPGRAENTSDKKPFVDSAAGEGLQGGFVNSSNMLQRIITYRVFFTVYILILTVAQITCALYLITKGVASNSPIHHLHF